MGQDYLRCISFMFILNTTHRCFQKELHGVTSTNPPPQGKDKMADERADGGMAAVQMHRESLLSERKADAGDNPSHAHGTAGSPCWALCWLSFQGQVSHEPASSRKPKFHPSAIALEHESGG